jgi:hypothetical protein
MDLKFALQTNCNIIKDTSRAVKVAGGGTLWSGAYIPPTTFTIQNETYENQFRILELPSYDIILGCDWQARHSPIGFDYVNRHLSIVKDGHKQLCIPACNTIVQATEIDAAEFDKRLQAGATGYVINLVQQSSSTSPSVPAEIEVIIQQFDDVFAPPGELPPTRTCDHTIPLQDSAMPPNTRPYRVPHKHKEELDRQIRELLESKIIRPSTSPFASPIILVNKKDHSWRLCVDYRKLNALTVKKIPYPLSRTYWMSYMVPQFSPN